MVGIKNFKGNHLGLIINALYNALSVSIAFLKNIKVLINHMFYKQEGLYTKEFIIL